MSPDLIFDIGMNNGADADFYLKKGYRVVSVEANPILCEKAANDLKPHIEQGRLKIYNIGIADKAGMLEFFVNKISDDWSSFDPSYGKRQNSFDTIEVECITFDDLLKSVGEVPYYLKIDIEGHDHLCLDALIGKEDLPKYVSVEAGVGDFTERMQALGYNRFKLISQVWHNLRPLPKPAREGKYVQQQMTGLHSGPFGDETYGTWLSGSVVAEEYKKFIGKDYASSLHKQMNCPQDVFEMSWWDFHAALGD